MTARKTMRVEDFKDYINGLLRDSYPSSTEAREAYSVVIGRVLADTDNYRGFRFTDPDDETRREYY